LRKWAVIAIATGVAVLAGASVLFRPDRAIRVATGYAAHNICSKTFVSGLDPQAVFANRGEVSAPRDEGDVLPASREFRAEVPANRARANDRDTHARSPETTAIRSFRPWFRGVERAA